MSPPQRTYCSAPSGDVIEGGSWDGYPRPCGALATGPHPDPEISYRQPLCARHYAEAVARYVPADLEELAETLNAPKVCLHCGHPGAAHKRNPHPPTVNDRVVLARWERLEGWPCDLCPCPSMLEHEMLAGL